MRLFRKITSYLTLACFTLSSLSATPVVASKTELPIILETKITQAEQNDSLIDLKAGHDTNTKITHGKIVRVIPDNLINASKGSAVVIKLDDEEFLLITERVENRGNGNISWFGKSKDDDLVTLTIVDGALAGTIILENKSFTIVPTTNINEGVIIETTNLTPISEENETIKRPTIPKDVIMKNIELDTKTSYDTIPTTQNDTTTRVIDILAFYTKEFKSTYGGESGVRAVVQNLVDVANMIHANSNTQTQIRVVGVFETEAKDGDDLSSTLDRMSASSDEFAYVYSLLETYKADIAILFRNLTDKDTACGLGYLLNDEQYYTNPAYKFILLTYLRAIVNVGSRSDGAYCPQDTLAHEVGHNMGCEHDRDHSSNNGVYPYSYGYCGMDSQGRIYGTTMSYCHPRIPYFSDNLVVEGKPIGNDSTRNAETIRLISPYVAATRSGDVTLYEVTVSKSGLGTVISNPSGISCGNDCSELYPADLTITLEAIPDTGYSFSNWEGDCATCNTNSKCEIYINSNKQCIAVFKQNTPQQYTVSVIKNGSGSGTVTSTPEGIDCGNSCSAPFQSNTVLTLTAVADTNSAFDGWGGDCSSCEDSNTCQFTVTSDKSCIASFAPAVHQITVSADGDKSGTVVSNPAGINLSYPSTRETSAEFNHNANVTLTATPEKDAIASWTNCPGQVSNSGDSVVCTIDKLKEDKQISVKFQSKTTSKRGTLKVIKSPKGSGQVISSPSGIFCGDDCSESYPLGTSVTLTATPDQNSVFKGWGRDCSYCGTNTSCVVSITRDKVCKASFTSGSLLTIHKSGNGTGTVKSDPSGIACGSKCSEYFPTDSVVKLTATPDRSSSFSVWRGDCTPCGSSSVCNIKMNSAKTCTALFSKNK